jgi:hypothetical protein
MTLKKNKCKDSTPQLVLARNLALKFNNLSSKVEALVGLDYNF